MGLAAGENFVIKSGDVVSPAVPTGGPNPYLALNWQRAEIWPRYASGDRRFPTPQPTTTHRFWPNQRRRHRPCYRFGYGIPDLPAGDITHKPTRGGGSAARISQKPSIEKRTRNFIANGSLLYSSSKKLTPNRSILGALYENAPAK
jgi:hypothetical protein